MKHYFETCLALHSFAGDPTEQGGGPLRAVVGGGAPQELCQQILAVKAAGVSGQGDNALALRNLYLLKIVITYFILSVQVQVPE